MNEENNFIEYTIPRDDIVYVTEFCNVDLSSQLLAVGTKLKVSIYQCKFKEEDEEVDDFEYQNLYDFGNECRVTAIAWSPETSLSIPKYIQLAVAGSDRRIKVFSSDLKSTSPVKPVVCRGHSDFINSMTFHPHRGDQLASTGDDKWCRIWDKDGNQEMGFQLGAPGMSVCWHRDEDLKIKAWENVVENEEMKLASTGDDKWCRIWDKDGNQEMGFQLGAPGMSVCWHRDEDLKEMVFQLGAPGMSVCWHRDEDLKIMVAQKDGVIKMFSLTGQHQLMSFDTGQTPLMEADWSLGNNGLLIGAVAGSYFYVFDVSVLSRPVDKQQIHVQGARHCRWSKCNDSLVATAGRPGRQVKVFNTKHQQNPVTIPQSLTYGISWHQHLPVLACGGDQKIHLYMFDYM